MVLYLFWCTVVVVISTCCFSNLSSFTTEELSKKLGKMDSCFFPSICRAAIPKTYRYSILAVEIPSLELVNSRDT